MISSVDSEMHNIAKIKNKFKNLKIKIKIIKPVSHDLNGGDDAYGSKKSRSRHRSWDMQ